jgi:DNA-directed RNA polymerase specialized sigma24 family protein
MTAIFDELDGALQSALLRSAIALTNDPVEAKALVTQTLLKADEEHRAGRAPPASQVQLFRMFRETYHSIERSRSRRPPRDAVVTALALANKPQPDEQRG